MTPAVEFRGVSVHFGATQALAPLDLSVARGETLALLGPSGSGKSTALKALAGFLRPSAGRVLLDGQDVTDLPPHRRGLGVVVQSYALFPHQRVADNVAFGLKARKTRRADVTKRVGEVLELVGMSEYARRYPRELSGGQQQRVALARALAIRPNVLLLDEPLSALDAALREDMVAELLRLRAELPDTTLIYVTHDQSEALALADRIAVLRDSRLVELGPCEQLYRRPATEFTASFLGAANLIPVELVRADGSVATVRLAGRELSAEPSGTLQPERPVALGVRPHRISVGEPGPDTFPALVRGVQWRGSGYRLDLRLTDEVCDIRAEVADSPVLPAVAPARRGTRPRRYRIGWLLPPAIVVAGFFGYPLVLVILQSFTAQDGSFGLSVWTQVLSSPEFGRAVWQTVLLALGSTVGCVLLGGFLALVVAFVPFPGATLLARLVDTVLAFPSFLIALAFTFLYGGAGVFGTAGFLYSPWGVLLAEITFYTPFVMRPALAAFSQVPPAQLDVAASLGARPGRVLWRVVLPEALPSLASGACLVLLLTMNEFGIVLFLGAKGVSTLPMLVYGKGIVTFDFPAASVVAVVNVVLSLVLYTVYRRAVGKGGRRAAVDAA